jgi:hypothetical protein
MAKYEICSAKISRFGETGVGICTSYLNASGYPRAESFFLIPDEKETMRAIRLRFDVKSFDDSPIELTEDFMLEQALGQLNIDLVHYLDDTHKNFSEMLDRSDLIQTRDIKFLVHVWVRGTCKRLQEVYSMTECDPLRNALRPILNLPTISRRPLD